MSDEYVCDVCGEAFESEQELQQHVHDVGVVD
jgi:DNA-directed RNA polymerase subunit RPC12/RpoP